MSEPPITRDATKPPGPIETKLVWTRSSTGKVPPENDGRVYLLRLVDGSFAVGRRRTLVRAVRASGLAFIRATAVPDLAPVVTSHFVEPLTGSVPIEGVRAWAAIEPPP